MKSNIMKFAHGELIYLFIYFCIVIKAKCLQTRAVASWIRKFSISIHFLVNVIELKHVIELQKWIFTALEISSHQNIRACVLGCEHGFLSAKSADCDAMDPNKVIRLKWRAIFHILRNQSYCYQTCYRKTMPKCLMSKVIFRSTWQKACRVHWNNSKFYSFNYSKTIFQRNECKHISNGITVLWHRNIHIFIGFNKRRWFAKFNKKNESNVCFDKVVTFFSLWHDVPPIRAKWWWCKTYGNNKVY